MISEVSRDHAQDRFSRIFSLSPMILSITRLSDGRLLDVNETFVRMTGYTREEALGRTPVELGLWLEPEKRAAGLDRLRLNQPLRNVEQQFRMKNGEVRVALCSAEIIELDGQPCVL